MHDNYQDLKLEGLRQPVSIFRNAYTILPIYAENEDGLCRAVGFAMAQYRVLQMDLLRRVTQ